MKLFNRHKKFPIKPNPKYVDITIDGEPFKLDKQLIDCIKYNAKMDITDHEPIFDIVGLSTGRIKGFPTDIVTIDYGDLLVTYEVVERDGEYKPSKLSWQRT